MTLRPLLLVLAFVGVVGSRAGAACIDWSASGRFADIDAADVVFEGAVLRIEKDATGDCAPDRVTFSVRRVWKGAQQADYVLLQATGRTHEVVVDGHRGIAGCPAWTEQDTFYVGRRYIVFASGRSDRLESMGCGLSRAPSRGTRRRLNAWETKRARGLMLPASGSDGAVMSEPARFLQRVAKRVPVTPLTLSSEQLAGIWSDTRHDGLSGSFLYLFDDGTFIHTHWSDILPETVYDKGAWHAEPGMLTLLPDNDVTWHPKTDRKFLMLRPQNGKNAALLFGVEWALQVFEELSAEQPKKALTWLILGSLTRERPWAEGEVAQVKARLGKDTWSWRPCFFTTAGCPHPGKNFDQK